MNIPAWVYGAVLILIVTSFSSWMRSRRRRRRRDEDVFVDVSARYAVIATLVTAALIFVPIVILGAMVVIWVISR